MTSDGSSQPSPGSLRTLRLSIVLTIIVLTIQGWTGDFVNLFSPYPTETVSLSVGGVLTALYDAGTLALYHGVEGLVLLVLATVVVALSFRSSKSRSVRVMSVVGAAAIVSALVGGVLFVLSDFQNSPNSAQMGGSFIGAYAFYFIELYFTKS